MSLSSITLQLVFAALTALVVFITDAWHAHTLILLRNIINNKNGN